MLCSLKTTVKANIYICVGAHAPRFFCPFDYLIKINPMRAILKILIAELILTTGVLPKGFPCL